MYLWLSLSVKIIITRMIIFLFFLCQLSEVISRLELMLCAWKTFEADTSRFVTAACPSMTSDDVVDAVNLWCAACYAKVLPRNGPQAVGVISLIITYFRYLFQFSFLHAHYSISLCSYCIENVIVFSIINFIYF